ncbi:putative transcriptional regulator, Crp/Fnr family [Emticicia oligotrophica DSM 17448]|uniref:Transcriptional regulator, Crp/Fnr family n=1 Tax=Emticicia oligotrophica (strain DSM 17448 / CIP 109782 / MTCC 6937 / GPTSA100-15) TaxID=929562 RepID=A0ABM5N2I0_EMTOG|nr:Crp/Fnr family transcriptional regulator [Emticicia oligotrophica]AFK03578.1 putative transcriptional regulator, Crp/Fnr family [Emticicia oligotrophica DSM 17448]
MHESIINYISKFVSLNSEELSVVESCMKFREIPKKILLLNAGDICNFEAYILKGCIREYFIDHRGQELTLEFAVEDWWVSDITSFENQLPSTMYIETLEDCQLLVLSRESKDELLARVPKLERMFRLMIQRHLSVLQKRLFRTVSYTAMDKLEEFTKRYPSLSQRVPQHYIASYLGITPEFLSRLRNRQLKVK